jgi:uncharacterized protein
VADSLQVDPFSFGLLLTSGDPGSGDRPAVRHRLPHHPRGALLRVLDQARGGQRLRIGRRTAADVGLTLVVIGLAVVWMQGIGVLLGPDYAGLISYFSPQTQIVPILIIGLGVDFAIHLLARYRAEVGPGATRRGLRDLLPHRRPDAAAVHRGDRDRLPDQPRQPGRLPGHPRRPRRVRDRRGLRADPDLRAGRPAAARPSCRRQGRAPRPALGTQKDATLPRVIGRTAWLAERAPVPTLLAATLLVVLGGYGFTQLDSEFNLTDFVPQDEPLLEVFDTLSDEFGGGFEESTEVLLRGDLATPEAHNALVASLAQAGEVDGRRDPRRSARRHLDGVGAGAGVR